MPIMARGGPRRTIKPGVKALFRLAQAENATQLPATWLQGRTHVQVAEAFGLQDVCAELNEWVEYLVIVLHDLGRGVEEEYRSHWTVFGRLCGRKQSAWLAEFSRRRSQLGFCEMFGRTPRGMCFHYRDSFGAQFARRKGESLLYQLGEHRGASGC